MKNWNPKLEIGDRVILYYMGGDHEISPLTRGTVENVLLDPFQDESEEVRNIIYYVRWDSGMAMSMLSEVDYWIKEEP